MKFQLVSPFTANSYGRQVYVRYHGGLTSPAVYEPVTITGEVGDWTITYQNGTSHKIGWNFILYVQSC